MSALDRLAVRVLERLAGSHPEVWSATETIARRLGVKVRAAQLRLARLVRAGLLRRAWDYSLKSRRRLLILWRDATAPASAPASSEAHEVGETGQDHDDDDRTAGAVETVALPLPPPSQAAPAPAQVPVSPPPARERERDGRRKATPEELAWLADVAKRAAPHDPGFPGWLRGQCRRWGLSWVLPAAEVAAGKKATVRDPRGYVAGTLVEFERRGGPPPPEPEKKKETEEEYIARVRALFKD